MYMYIPSMSCDMSHDVLYLLGERDSAPSLSCHGNLPPLSMQPQELREGEGDILTATVGEECA